MFEADIRAGELRRNGVKVRLQDLPFRALTLLLTRPGEVITREEFRQALWPSDVFVDFEQGISSAVMRLRDALRDSADNPIFIETIERRGYRWIGPYPTAANPEPRRGSQRRNRKSPEKTTNFKRRSQQALSKWRKLVFVAADLARAVRRLDLSPRLSRSQSRREIQLPPPASASTRQSRGRRFLPQRPFLLEQAHPREPESGFGRLQLRPLLTIPTIPTPMWASPTATTCCANSRPCREMRLISRLLQRQKKRLSSTRNLPRRMPRLASSLFLGLWDAADAEKEFRRAIELDPNNVKAHHWYATFLHALDATRKPSQKSNWPANFPRIPPQSSPTRGIALDAGQHEQALQLLKQLEAADPDFVSPHRLLEIRLLRNCRLSLTTFWS